MKQEKSSGSSYLINQYSYWWSFMMNEGKLSMIFYSGHVCTDLQCSFLSCNRDWKLKKITLRSMTLWSGYPAPQLQPCTNACPSSCITQFYQSTIQAYNIFPDVFSRLWSKIKENILRFNKIGIWTWENLA